MRKIKIKDFDYEDQNTSIKLNEVDSFIDRDGCLIILPTFYSIFLSQNHSVYRSIKYKTRTNKIRKRYELFDITESTRIQYIGHIKDYLTYLEEKSSKDVNFPSIHLHENASEKFINEYINEELIIAEGKGYKAVSQAISAINEYYTYLAVAGLSDVKKLKIKKGNKATAIKNTKRKTAPKYITLETRNTLKQHADSIRDELILRMGCEVGLRTKELCGLFLDDFEYGGETRQGIQTLIDLMQKDKKVSPDEDKIYTYFLCGTLTKQSGDDGGLSRDLYFSSSLLARIEEYLLIERPSSSESALFLKVDTQTVGQPISENAGTEVFKKYKIRLIGMIENESIEDQYITFNLHKDDSYHHLRHTFGTEKFYSLLGGRKPGDITEDSNVIVQVSKLMGHKVDTKRGRQKITRDYIRSCDQLIILEQK